MSAPEIRVNARLAGEDARRFRELQLRHKLSATDVLRRAIRNEHERSVKPRKSAWQIMSESGLIGSMHGPPDLSSNIRHYFGEAMRKKYPQHYRKGPAGKKAR